MWSLHREEVEDIPNKPPGIRPRLLPHAQSLQSQMGGRKHQLGVHTPILPGATANAEGSGNGGSRSLQVNGGLQVTLGGHHSHGVGLAFPT